MLFLKLNEFFCGGGETKWFSPTLLSPVHTVTENGDCRRKRRLAVFGDKLSPKSIVAEIGDYSRQCGQAFGKIAACTDDYLFRLVYTVYIDYTFQSNKPLGPIIIRLASRP